MSQITKRAIMQSLKELMLKKPLNKITVNDLTENCGINRMTFYYHFKNIYDLVEWACMEETRAALEKAPSYETWQQGYLQIFEMIRENKPFVMNLYRCVHQEQVEKYIKPHVDKLVLHIINEESDGICVQEEDKEFIARVYSYIFIGLTLDWIKTDLRDEPEQIVNRLAVMIKGTMAQTLDRFKN